MQQQNEPLNYEQLSSNFSVNAKHSQGLTHQDSSLSNTSTNSQCSSLVSTNYSWSPSALTRRTLNQSVSKANRTQFHCQKFSSLVSSVPSPVVRNGDSDISVPRGLILDMTTHDSSFNRDVTSIAEYGGVCNSPVPPLKCPSSQPPTISPVENNDKLHDAKTAENNFTCEMDRKLPSLFGPPISGFSAQTQLENFPCQTAVSSPVVCSDLYSEAALGEVLISPSSSGSSRIFSRVPEECTVKSAFPNSFKSAETLSFEELLSHCVNNDTEAFLKKTAVDSLLSVMPNSIPVSDLPSWERIQAADSDCSDILSEVFIILIIRFIRACFAKGLSCVGLFFNLIVDGTGAALSTYMHREIKDPPL